MLGYQFMQRALLAGAALAVTLPLIGVTLVLRRTSMTGDALAHCSLAGVAGGLVAGIDPVVGALVACVIASLSMEGMRRRMPRSADLTIAIVSAVGAGLAGILSSFAGNTRSLDDYLFGSIVAVSADELQSVLMLSCGVVAFWIVVRRALFSISVDESMARASGVRVAAVEVAFALVTGVVISISARIIGSLVVSSMLVTPVAVGLQVARSYRATIATAVVASLVSTMGGLVVSWYLALRPGGAIVLLGALILGACMVGGIISGRTR